MQQMAARSWVTITTGFTTAYRRFTLLYYDGVRRVTSDEENPLQLNSSFDSLFFSLFYLNIV